MISGNARYKRYHFARAVMQQHSSYAYARGERLM
jgi:hypothetical protein